MTQYTVRKVKVVGTKASPEEFTTGLGKLAYLYGATAFPAIDLSVLSVSVSCNETLYQDAEIWCVSVPVQSGTGIKFNLAISDTGSASSDGNFYCDITFYLQTFTPETVIDSISLAIRTSYIALSNGNYYRGNCLKGNGSYLTSVTFFGGRFGLNPATGDIIARLYTHTGTYGVNGVGTGTQLAQSLGVDASTLSPDASLSTFNPVVFTFAVPYFLVDTTPYVIVLDWNNGAANRYIYFAEAGSIPTGKGNECYYNYSAAPFWAAVAGRSIPFTALGKKV